MAFVTAYHIVTRERSKVPPKPSMEPTSSPTFDPRSTLDVALERGNIRCGLYIEQNTNSMNLGLVCIQMTDAVIRFRGTSSCPIHSSTFLYNILFTQCKAIAAVVLNNPESFVLTYVTTKNRFQMLRDRQVDVLVGGETFTVEREVFEVRTPSLLHRLC